MLWCHAACNRGSDRSRRGHWATSDNPALAPRPGSRASRPRIAQWPSRAGRRRGQQRQRRRKVRVVALAPGLASREVNLVAAQEPPDILDVNIAQRLGQQGAGPARKPLRGQLIQQLQNPLVSGLRIDRLLAGPRLVLQPFKAMVGIAVPPKADNPRLASDFFVDRAGAAPVRRQQNYPRRFKSRCNVTGERQHASSTLRSFRERWTSLASGIIHILNHDSRSKKSGY